MRKEQAACGPDELIRVDTGSHEFPLDGSPRVIGDPSQSAPESVRYDAGQLTVRLYVEREGDRVLVDLAQSGDLRALNVALSVLTTVRNQLASLTAASGSPASVPHRW